MYGENNGALITDPKPNPESFMRVITHFLDYQGRIVRDVTDEFETGSIYTTYYQYDGRGNLFRSIPGYDNGLNPYLTNPVWRFVYKDYSINNPLNESNFQPPSSSQNTTPSAFRRSSRTCTQKPTCSPIPFRAA
ncbi:hypothetical protein ACQ86N_24770 [Puia sp. P3]|uniref:hypothetical protein n=1 Tax=Puia sp. P3 TaxID=3423952 RepID=UPI003D66C04F